MPVNYTIYFYGGKFAGPELSVFKCPSCGRIQFKHNSQHIMISNAYGAGVRDIIAGQRDDDGKPIIQTSKCHGCKASFKILFA